MQPALEHPAAHRRHRTVEYRGQGVVGAAGQILGDLEVTAGGGIHNDAVLLAFHGDGTDVRQRGALSVFDILQQAAGGAQAAWGVFHAEADQIAGAELQVKLLARGVDFKFPQRATAQTAAALDQRRFGKIFRIQQFRRISTLQLCRHGFAVGRFTQAKAPGADIQRRVTKALAVLPDGGQQVVLALLQQRFIADGARRNDTHHFTLDRSLGGGRIANLLANGHRLALIDQFGEVVLHSVVGDAGHRDGFARGGAALGQRDIEQLRRAFRIVIK